MTISWYLLLSAAADWGGRGVIGLSVAGCVRWRRRVGCGFRRTGAGHRIFDRADPDVYLGTPASGSVGGGAGRVEAQCYRVPVSTEQEASLENREKMLRDSAGGVVHPVSEDRG
ncbi:hypothetical protein [Rhodococcus jostii]|uniref:hypothetical protein n=1 Tax=Rhodococcus jostii TaxID=132919 RepID=UPI00115FA377|nr:hypothetical protein [Rhodococcus jostii]